MFQRLKQRYWLIFLGTFVLFILYQYRELINMFGFEQRPDGAMTSKILMVNSMEYQGLGNQMFEAAAILGTNQRKNNKFLLCIPPESKLSDVFHHGFCTWPPRYLKNVEDFSENSFATYDNRTLFITTEKDVIFHGYFQSWKYFSGAEQVVRQQFKFKDWIEKSAEIYLINSLRQHLDLKQNSVVENGVVEGNTLIGVHVRRGDMVEAASGSLGYALAPVEYIHRAIDFMDKRYPNSLFLICSDDPRYCRVNINHPRAVFIFTGDAKVDLAILSKCKHSIITVGTYGWWSAWLANGTTVYYENFLVPGSELAKKAYVPDYFPPHWIPMK